MLPKITVICQQCGIAFEIAEWQKDKNIRFHNRACYLSSDRLYTRKPISERFWKRVHKLSGKDACWLWTGSKNPDGYGHINIGDHKSDRAHRVAWEVQVGPIPKGKSVLHRCDTPACCRGSHLFLGTHADNMADMCAKGRQRTGARTIVTFQQRQQIIELRAKSIFMRTIGDIVGLSKATVCRVLNGKI